MTYSSLQVFTFQKNSGHLDNFPKPWTTQKGAGWREWDAMPSSRYPQNTQVKMSSRQLEIQIYLG